MQIIIFFRLQEEFSAVRLKQKQGQKAPGQVCPLRTVPYLYREQRTARQIQIMRKITAVRVPQEIRINRFRFQADTLPAGFSVIAERQKRTIPEAILQALLPEILFITVRSIFRIAVPSAREMRIWFLPERQRQGLRLTSAQAERWILRTMRLLYMSPVPIRRIPPTRQVSEASSDI